MYWPEPKDTCSVCRIRPAVVDHIYFCSRCGRALNQATLKALVKTIVCLLPEVLALVVILAVLPASGHANWWLVIPVVVLALPRSRYVFARSATRSIERYIEQSGMAQVWSAEFVIERAREDDAYVRNAIRREAIALAIVLTPELEEALRGQRHPRDLSDRDIVNIRPAVEAAMKRDRDRQAALGIEATLPRGDDPAC